MLPAGLAPGAGGERDLPRSPRRPRPATTCSCSTSSSPRSGSLAVAGVSPGDRPGDRQRSAATAGSVIRVDREIDVDRSAAEVFDRLTRIEDLPRWQPAIVEAALDVRRADRRRQHASGIVADAAGQRTEAIGTVTEFVRPERIGLEATAGLGGGHRAAWSSAATGERGRCRVVDRRPTIRLGGHAAVRRGDGPLPDRGRGAGGGGRGQGLARGGLSRPRRRRDARETPTR